MPSPLAAGASFLGPGAYDTLAAEPSVAGWLVVTVTVANRTLRALIDSGAGHSLLTRSGMARLGLREDAAGSPATLSGIGPEPVGARMQTFADMRIGSETIKPARTPRRARSGDARNRPRAGGGLARASAGVAVIRDRAGVRAIAVIEIWSETLWNDVAALLPPGFR